MGIKDVLQAIGKSLKVSINYNNDGQGNQNIGLKVSEKESKLGANISVNVDGINDPKVNALIGTVENGDAEIVKLQSINQKIEEQK